MRKVIFNIMVSLDGFYEDRNGTIDWHYADEEHMVTSNKLLDETDTLIMGRVTYELMAAYWPTVEDEDDGVTRKMNGLRKLVYSRTLQSADWQNSVIGSRDIAAEIHSLKQQPGGKLVMFGSANLARTFVEQDLFDEYQILVCPILLGDGKPLFSGLDALRRLTLTESKSRRSGVVELTYVPVRDEP